MTHAAVSGHCSVQVNDEFRLVRASERSVLHADEVDLDHSTLSRNGKHRRERPSRRIDRPRASEILFSRTLTMNHWSALRTCLAG